MFSIEEAGLIKHIPIYFNNYPDKLIWTSSTQGSFSVRSAYHLHMELMETKRSQASSSSNQGGFWSSMWKLKIPLADRIFLWRACQEGSNLPKSIQEKGGGKASFPHLPKGGGDGNSCYMVIPCFSRCITLVLKATPKKFFFQICN